MKNEVQKFKIGEELIVDQDYELKGCCSEDVIKVRKGDKILVVKQGFKYLTGDAGGKWTIRNDIDKTQFDEKNIALRIVENLINTYGYSFKDFMEEEDIDKRDLVEVVLEELSEFI